MSTPADVLKDIIEAGTYDTYRENAAPSVKIKGKDDLTTAPPDRMIRLENKNEEPLFTVAGSRLGAGNSYVDLIMYDQDPGQRDNLQKDLESVFKETNYGITFTIPTYNDTLSPYSKTLRVKILL